MIWTISVARIRAELTARGGAGAVAPTPRSGYPMVSGSTGLLALGRCFASTGK